MQIAGRVLLRLFVHVSRSLVHGPNTGALNSGRTVVVEAADKIVGIFVQVCGRIVSLEGNTRWYGKLAKLRCQREKASGELSTVASPPRG